MQSNSPPQVESAPSPGVSNLRQAFERLASRPTSPAPSDPNILSPNQTPSRVLSPAIHVDKPPPPPIPPRHLRPTISSSNVWSASKRDPPPPPPLRGSSPAPGSSSVRKPPSSPLRGSTSVASERHDFSHTPSGPIPPGPSVEVHDEVSLESPFDDPSSNETGRYPRGPSLQHSAKDPYDAKTKLDETHDFPGIQISVRPPPLPARNRSPFKLPDQGPPAGTGINKILDAPASPRMMATTRQSSIQSSVLSPPDRSYIRDPFASVVPDNSMKIVTPNGLTSPPALPARKVTTTSSSSLFPHPYTPPPHSAPPEISIVEPKPIRAGLRPPPKRSITLGEKLPPARRPPSETSSESEDEDSKGKLDSLPLADRASRRPPLFQSYNLSNFKIHVPAHDGLATVSGDIVIVAAPHRLKIYDISQSDSPIHSLDTKRLCADHRIQDFKVSAIEFISPSVSPGKSYVWLGCKEGHLIEVDALVGRISSIKYAAHTGTVSHIFRYRSNMVTVDVHGKALVFSLGSGVGHGSGLVDLNPQVLRIAEKPAFVKMLGKQLWVASHSSDSLGPSTIKTYNLFSSTFGVGYPVACDRLTPVLSGTIIPSQEDRVYLGHVGGFISVFSLSPDGKPTLQETIKISASDVLSLEGVNTRLWAGGRNGNIMVFDVDVKPWRVTNCWMAHVNVPVLRLAVDTKSILDLKRLPVYSIGRDEQLRFWDGLLGADWIEHRMLEQEAQFCAFRSIKLLIVSWNLDSAKPETLVGKEANYTFLSKALRSVPTPDIIVFGFQELIDLESRKMAAKTVLLGSKHKAVDGSISQRVTSSYKKWYDHLVLAVQLAMPASTPYTVVHTESLVGLFSCVLVKNSECQSLRHVAISTVKCGMGGRYGNKGGIVARFVIDDTSLCFVNCHLAAGQKHIRQRNRNISAMLNSNSVFPATDILEESCIFVNGGDGTMILDHEAVFISGDMNYRIDLSHETVMKDVKTGNITHLLSQDQLVKELQVNPRFSLQLFKEAPITFLPTYKYDQGSDTYDTSEKQRIPAWCDRILWRSFTPEYTHNLHYQRYEVDVSDHRPISGGFEVVVKSIDSEAQARIKDRIQQEWTQEEQNIIDKAKLFYTSYY